MGILALLVHLAVGISSVLLIVRVSAARPASPRGTSARAHDVYEAAFLAGGPARVVDTALAALHADGRIAVGGPGVLSLLRPVAHDPVERAVFAQLAHAPSGALHTVRLNTMRSPAVQEIGDVLAARGLMVPPGGTGPAAWGVAQAAACAIGLPLAFVLTLIESFGDASYDSGVPFVFLVFPVLVAGTVIGAMQAGRARRRVIPAGHSALRAYRAEHARPQSSAELVALHGMRGVPDPALRAQLGAAARFRATPTGTGTGTHGDSWSYTSYGPEPVWCAGSSPGSGCGSSSGGSGCGGSSGSSCGGSSGGSSCGGSSSSS
ncbi:TIGR04222 domain-containing membrane protein [Streptomyces sp. NPDC096176]|uniref:TIGR04222 domain-containing membrane protein n=1 Tax=Streptomyces sp. NPDC096176 TaxID=3366079 RepID=UPI0037FDA5F2